MKALRITVLSATLLVLAPASAYGRFFGGLVPDLRARQHPAPRAHVADLPYGGGPVLHFNDTRVIFWQPSASQLTFEPGYESLVERFLTDVAADSREPTNVYGLSGQYHDSQGPAAYQSSYRGAVVASDPLPLSGCNEPAGPPLGTGPGWHYCLTAEQLEAEVQQVLNEDHLPQKMNDVYFLVMPDGLGSCEFTGPRDCALGGDANDGYCGYHSTTDQNVPYAVIPYNAVAGHCQSSNPRPNANAADPAISTISHEHNEAVTDPLGNAWIDSDSHEDGDLCITTFGSPVGGAGATAFNEVIHGHDYWLQDEWSNTSDSCQARAPGDEVSFAAPRRGVRGRSLRFSAHVGRSEARIRWFNWYFGDHRRARHKHARHTYMRTGSYRIVLRVTDRWGNWAFYARKIRIQRA